MKRILKLFTLAVLLFLVLPLQALAGKPEIFLQMGHSGKVIAVALSPDGKYALTAAQDYMIKLWDVAGNREIRTLQGHTNWVETVAFSPDGKLAVSGGKDDTVRLWDLATGKEIRKYRSVWVSCVAFSPDGKQVMSGGANRTFFVWDVATGAVVRQSVGQPSRIIAFSPDGRRAVLANWDTTVILQDIATGRDIKTFTGHKDDITSAAVSRDGRFVLSGSRDKTARLWDVSTGREIRIFKGHSEWVSSVAFSPDGRYALSGSYDNTMKLWDTETGKEVMIFKGHYFRVEAVAFSSDGSRILSGGGDHIAMFWNAVTGKPTRIFTGFVRTVTVTAVSLDGRFALSGDANGTLKLWDITSGSEIRTFKGHKGQIFAVGFSPDGRHALSGSEDKTLKLWDIATGREIRTYKGHGDSVSAAAFSPDGKYILSGSWDTTLKLWNTASGEDIRTFTGDKSKIISVAISPDSRYAVSGSESYTAKVWDMATGKDLRTFKGHDGRVPSVAFSPDGKHILSGSSDRLVKLWEPATGREIKTFTGHADWVEAVAFSPDGRYAVSGSEDKTIKLWDIATGREIRTFKGHAGKVNNVAVTPDGKRIVSGSGIGITFIAFHGSGGDNTARVWDIATGKEIAQFVSFVDDEWVAITGDGFFKASKYGPTSLNIRQDGQVFGLHQFYDVFYRPDIVEAGLRGEDTTTLEDTNLEEALRNPPPMVEFADIPAETGDRKITIKYRVTSNRGGGIGEVRLFHNGKLIQSDGFYRRTKEVPSAPTTLLANNSRAIREEMRSVALIARKNDMPGLIESPPKGEKYEGAVTIDAIAGENDIGLAAFNRNNSVQSILRTATFKSTLSPDSPGLYILAIGIDEYKAKENNLKFAVKDAETFARILAERSETLYRSKDIHVTVLKNSEAAKAGIMGKIEYLSRSVKPGDVFVLFIASHGVLKSGLYSIVTHDYNGRLDTGNLINSAEIMDISKRIKALTQIVILDTCHAGGLDNFVSGLYDARMTVMARNMGLHMFASASSTQEALDGYKGKNGMFTYTLLEGLNNNRNADANKDSKVSIYELGEYAKERTAKYSQETGHRQTPIVNDFGKDISVYVIR